MRRAIAALVLAAVPAVAVAQTGPGDFARAATIRVEPGGSIFRVMLPDDVYSTVTRADLADVRVFNSAGDALPHALRAAPPPARTDAEWRTVPTFAMTEMQSGTAAKTHVRVGTDGAVIEVTGDSATRRATTAYLVDATGLEGPTSAMALSWTSTPGATFLARVSVLGSDDLDHWKTLVQSSAVAQLQHDTSTLTQNEIDLPASGPRTRYLQITWPKELAAVVLTSVRLRPRPQTASPEVRWRTLTPERADARKGISYDTSGLFPVEYVQVEFVDPAEAAVVLVQSRPSPSSEWVRRHSGLFYSASDTRGAARNPSAHISRTSDRYWRIDTTDERAWKPGREPHLQVGWHPHELVFLAQGPPPYVLAYGSGRVGPASAPVDALLARLEEGSRTSQVAVATLDQPQTTGGIDALKPAPPVRRIALWAVLFAAVGILALLALRVFRNTDPAS